VTIADPKCERCGARGVFIGIGPGAEVACSRDCAGKCPSCLSPRIEPYARWSYYAFVDASSTLTRHCLPCGHVFDEPKE